MTRESAFDWIAHFTDEATALGVIMQWAANDGGLFYWMRDERDAAAVLGLMGVGKHHNREMANALMGEPKTPPELAIIAAHLQGEATGRGRPPKSPLTKMRDAGLAAAMRSRHAKGQTLTEEDARLSTEMGLSVSRLRAIREAHTAKTAPKFSGRPKKKR